MLLHIVPINELVLTWRMCIYCYISNNRLNIISRCVCRCWQMTSTNSSIYVCPTALLSMSLLLFFRFHLSSALWSPSLLSPILLASILLLLFILPHVLPISISFFQLLYGCHLLCLLLWCSIRTFAYFFGQCWPFSLFVWKWVGFTVSRSQIIQMLSIDVDPLIDKTGSSEDFFLNRFGNNMSSCLTLLLTFSC